MCALRIGLLRAAGLVVQRLMESTDESDMLSYLCVRVREREMQIAGN